MSTDERYDIVIVGGGFNGVTTAAYLSKCGLSVCVLEERVEAGGGCESAEPIAGVRINPHAILMYGAPAPGFEQLELWKYGFRMDWDPNVHIDMYGGAGRGMVTTAGLSPITEKDGMGWAKITGMIGDPPFYKDLMRATFWCPPHPVGIADQQAHFVSRTSESRHRVAADHSGRSSHQNPHLLQLRSLA